MAKLNKAAPYIRSGQGPIRSVSNTPDIATFNGADAFARDAKSDLFLLGVANFSGEGSYYESAEVRDQRFVSLVRSVAQSDPIWIANFLRWLRGDGNVRTASIIGAIEAARVVSAVRTEMTPVYVPTARQILSSVLQRADEPGEAAAYWLANYPNQKMPKWFKRALGDAAKKLYTEYSALKYDTSASGVRFGDVLEFADFSGSDDSPLFKWLLNRNHSWVKDPFHNPRLGDLSEALPMAVFASKLNGMPKDEARTYLINHPQMAKHAGITWEQMSGFGAMDAKAWESVIPTMGYMALLRNLRNFDQAGISSEAVDFVISKLTDPQAVAKSRQFPFRFLSAYLAARDSDNWSKALGKALDLSTQNIPNDLAGTALILVDTSGSMQATVSDKSQVTMHQAAALFASALAKKVGTENVTFVEFGTTSQEYPIKAGASVLKNVADSMKRNGQVGWGTNMQAALTKHYKGQQRIYIFSDMQVSRYVDTSKIKVPTYAFNLAGYSSTIVPGGGNTNWTELGGLTDRTFTLIPVLEARQAGRWPWE